MKKILLLLSAVTALGMADTTLSFKTGLNGDVKANQTASVPLSFEVKHEKDNFKVGFKTENEGVLDFTTNSGRYNMLDTKGTLNLGYTTPRLSRTAWHFSTESSMYLLSMVPRDFSAKLESGLDHVFGIFTLKEDIKYEFATNKNNLLLKLGSNLNFYVSSIDMYVESGYDFVGSNVLFNGKLSATIKQPTFKYSPYFETINKFGKSVSTLNTLEIGAFDVNIDALNIKTELNLKFDGGIGALRSMFDINYGIKVDEAVTITPEFKINAGLTFDPTPFFLVKPMLKLGVSQSIYEKLSMKYEFEYTHNMEIFPQNSGVNPNYQLTHTPNLSATFSLNYTF